MVSTLKLEFHTKEKVQTQLTFVHKICFACSEVGFDAFLMLSPSNVLKLLFMFCFYISVHTM